MPKSIRKVLDVFRLKSNLYQIPENKISFNQELLQQIRWLFYNIITKVYVKL